MVFENLKQLIETNVEIEIKGQTEQIRKLSVSEREQYDKLVNKGLGKVQMGLGQARNTQTSNFDVEKATDAQNKANRYLVKRSFATDPTSDSPVTDEDIDALYDLYPIMVEEIKKANNIGEVNTEEVESKLKN